MFGQLSEWFEQLRNAQHLMKDERFRALISHPKVQDVLRDPELQTLMKAKDMTRIAGHPKFLSLIRDPEVNRLIASLNPGTFLGSSSGG